MKRIWGTLKEITSYPTATIGLIIIFALIVVAIYTLITLPYSEAIRLWRGGEDVWYDHPKKAEPVWMNWFRNNKLPETIIVDSQDSERKVEVISEGTTKITYDLSFDFPYDGFPQEITVFFNSKFNEKSPFISMYWLTPDGREIRITDMTGDAKFNYRFNQDAKLERRLNGLPAEQGLFANLDAEIPYLVRGTYTLRIEGLIFEEGSDYNAKLIVYGKVHGWAGTDHQRRDLMVSMLWGTPIALSFGLLAAVGTTTLSMIISAVGVWMGGWIDELIQRVTETSMILPVLPILIMVGTFYSRQLSLMLGVIVLLTIFGGAIKQYRAVFMQVKESPYIEAAEAYGATNTRMIFRYLIPRIIPIMLPAFVIGVPSYVFLEATLAVLNLGDPVLPTWGKVIYDARTNGALFSGLYYWILEPAVLLSLTGIAFAMVGYSMDRIFNPRLRGV